MPAGPKPDRLLEQGQSHDDFSYVSRLVGAHYEINDQGNLVLIDEMRDIYAFGPGDHESVRFECGLSSLEYDPYHARVYLLTSFETEQDGAPCIGGYLWVIRLEDLREGKSPSLVYAPEGPPLEFEYKAEGLAVLDHAPFRCL